MIQSLVAEQAQFIIATHSPIILAYPGATILHFEAGRIERAAYDELEHVFITRTFLNNPHQYLDRLTRSLPGNDHSSEGYASDDSVS